MVDCLIDLTVRVGVPNELLTDNGTNFMSKVVKQFCQTTGIRQIKTSPFHPQTGGMVERFNATLKHLLRKLTQDPRVEWDKCLLFVLWAYRGTVHSSSGFSPFHLLFGRELHMPLDELTRYWRGKEENSAIDMAEHIQVMRANMELVREVAYHKETKEKESQKTQHDKKAVERVFNVGDFVWKSNKLISEWQGPFIITQKLTEVTYKVDTGTARKQFKMFHVNAMKQWTSPGPAVFCRWRMKTTLKTTYPLRSRKRSRIILSPRSDPLTQPHESKFQ